MPSFEAQLAGLVDRHVRNAGVTKTALAKKAGLHISMLNHLTTGRRKPRGREMIRSLARALELSGEQTDNLLLAAELAPLSDEERAVEIPAGAALEEQMELAAQSLEAPDKELLRQRMEQDVRLLVEAWTGYLDLRKALYRRDWGYVAERAAEGTQNWYWPLRQVSARFQARVHLVRATAEEHLGRLTAAEGLCHEAFAAADTAGDPVTKSLSLIRLGDLYKLTGQFNSATDAYRRASDLIETWDSDAQTDAAWKSHWNARVNRKLGSLFLFLGDPASARDALNTSRRVFEGEQDSDLENGHDYECSRVYYSLGWAHSLLGDWDGALNWHLKGIRKTQQLRWRDERGLFQGHLYLMGDHLDRGEYEHALEHFEAAQRLTRNGKLAGGTYHEVGRLYQQYAKLLRDTEPTQSSLDEAERLLRESEQFYSEGNGEGRRRDPVRLASIQNVWGRLLMKRRQYSQALERFEKARRFAEQADPPNTSYVASAMYNRCDVLLHLEDNSDQIQKAIEEAVVACRSVRGNSAHYRARVEIVRAKYLRRFGSGGEAIDACAADALEFASRYNRFLLREVVDSLLSIDPSQHMHEVIARAAARLLDEPGLLAPYDRELSERLMLLRDNPTRARAA